MRNEKEAPIKSSYVLRMFEGYNDSRAIMSFETTQRPNVAG